MESPVITSSASVLIFQEDSKTWIYSGNVQAISCVQILKRDNIDFYRIVAWRQPENHVVLNSIIKPSLKFKSHGKFQQWRDVNDSQVYGLQFSDDEESSRFCKTIFNILDSMKCATSIDSYSSVHGTQERIQTSQENSYDASPYVVSKSPLINVPDNQCGVESGGGTQRPYQHRRQFSVSSATAASSVSSYGNNQQQYCGTGSLASYASSSGVSSGTANTTGPPSMHYAVVGHASPLLMPQEDYAPLPSSSSCSSHFNTGNGLHEVDDGFIDETADPRHELRRMAAQRDQAAAAAAASMSREPSVPPAPRPPPPPVANVSVVTAAETNHQPRAKCSKQDTSCIPTPPPAAPPPPSAVTSQGPSSLAEAIRCRTLNPVEHAPTRQPREPPAPTPVHAMMAEMQQKILARRLALEKTESGDEQPTSESQNSSPIKELTSSISNEAPSNEKSASPLFVSNLKSSDSSAKKNKSDPATHVTMADLMSVRKELTVCFTDELSKAKYEILNILKQTSTSNE